MQNYIQEKTAGHFNFIPHIPKEMDSPQILLCSCYCCCCCFLLLLRKRNKAGCHLLCHQASDMIISSGTCRVRATTDNPDPPQGGKEGVCCLMGTVGYLAFDV